ncbi:MAG: hypothetical protein ACYDAC_12305 [Candidatus Dormibacteria bacterium]
MSIARPRLPLPARLVAGCGLVAAAVAACGPTPPVSTPRPTAPPTSAPASASAAPTQSSLTLQQAVLAVSDFSSGASAGSSSNVPDLTNVKCTPNTTSGLQQQYKSDVVAASGREYGNVVAAFDNSSDASSFITTFYSDAQSCSDASSAPIQDNFGTYSFYFQITGSPNDLRVEAVQYNQYITVVIQFIPSGTQPDQQSLRDLTNTSLTKLQQVSG